MVDGWVMDGLWMVYGCLWMFIDVHRCIDRTEKCGRKLSMTFARKCRGDVRFKSLVKKLSPYCILAGGVATPLKNMKVNWDDEIPKSYGK